METDCLFCNITKRNIPARLIYEDENTLAFLDIRPVNDGHALVIPKKHFKDIYDIPTETLGHLASTAQKVAQALKNSGAEGVNIIMNNGSAADQVIFHAHLHIIPRFKGDGREPWHGSPKTTEELEIVAQKISNFLS